MVKAQARMPDGRYLIVMGISEGNVIRLKQGDPLYFDPAVLKIPPGATIGYITVFYGTDDADLHKTLDRLMGPQTEVIHIPKGDDAPQ